MGERCVVFQTPGLIPLESFTTFGVNAKPMSTSPFGYFGTGLKYAIAVLLRTGHKVVLWRGNDKYTFYVRQQDFRGKGFDFVRMKKERWLPSFLAWAGPKYEQLPFTTELGKNWELWQAFRELESNTRDENGQTFVTEQLGPPMHGVDTTQFCVYGSRFEDEFHDRERHFLPDGLSQREDVGIQVIDRPSRHIYYRGVRIMDLKEEAEYTYNFLQTVELTEDRTAKYPYQLEQAIAQLIRTSNDEGYVNRALRTRGFEGSINHGYGYGAPSPIFMSVAQDSVNPTARQVWEEHQASAATTTTIRITIPKPYLEPEEIAAVHAALGEILGGDIKLVVMDQDMPF
jgi:hypothetical protein